MNLEAVGAERSRDQNGSIAFYTACGLNIASELPLPELRTTDPRHCDLTFRLVGNLPPRPAETDLPALTWQDDKLVLTFEGAGRFTIDAGAGLVEVETVGGDHELARLPLLGPVLACFLHLRGDLVMHASAVQLVDGRTIALVGDKGAGKSTTAALLVDAGATLVTDDLLVCRFEAGEPKCLTSFPQCKLNPDALAEVELMNAELLPKPHPLFPKAQLRLPHPELVSTPLRALCILTRGTGLLPSRLQPSLALPTILGNAYIARYGPSLLSGPRHAVHFSHCVRLAQTLPVFVLQTPSTLGELREALPTLQNLL